MKNIRRPKRIISLLAAVLLIGICLFVFSGRADIRYVWNGFFEDKDLAGEKITSDLSVHFMDVGQGDCTLVLCGGEAMLIDSGESGCDEQIERYLANMGVEKFRYVIATHPHSDHIGSMSKLLNSFDADMILLPELPDALIPTSSCYKNLLKAIQDHSVKGAYAKAGERYKLGDAEFTVLGPVNRYEELNNMSVVIRLTYGGTSFLFTGDAEKQAEYDMLANGADVSADVLKVGHHGSGTSSAKRFIRTVSPETAVIMVGQYNAYGHPDEKTLQTLADEGIDIFRTDLCGTVTAVSDGENIKFYTEKK